MHSNELMILVIMLNDVFPIRIKKKAKIKLFELFFFLSEEWEKRINVYLRIYVTILCQCL
jgi:hypothetical protein